MSSVNKYKPSQIPLSKENLHAKIYQLQSESFFELNAFKALPVKELLDLFLSFTVMDLHLL